MSIPILNEGNAQKLATWLVENAPKRCRAPLHNLIFLFLVATFSHFVEKFFPCVVCSFI